MGTMHSADGVVVLLKPPGMTSSNAVYDVRKILSVRHAGHLGTLDPGAAGVLPVCMGRATKLFDLLVDKRKEYVFEIAFGAQTDTQDAYGRVMARDARAVGREQVLRLLPALLGAQEQTASIYSALKVDGRKMYDLARAGETIEPRTRTIEIHALDYLAQTGENRHLLRVVCSRGTYVRALCECIAARLGTLAYLSFLLRTRSGSFTLSQAISAQELTAQRDAGALKSCVVSCEDALCDLPALRLDESRLIPARNGLETHVNGVPDGVVRLYAGAFLGVGRVSGGSVRLAVHLY